MTDRPKPTAEERLEHLTRSIDAHLHDINAKVGVIQRMVVAWVIVTFVGGLLIVFR